MGYVFISYSSKDIDYADTIKREFEKNGIKTWMAPGDIPAGTTYAGVIARALKEADGLVLLLTNHSQESIWVDKEVERALNYKKIIIPLALENVKLNDNFEFYLGNQQIVQVRQLSDKNGELAKVITRVKSLTGVDTTQNKPDPARNEPVSTPGCDSTAETDSTTAYIIKKANDGDPEACLQLAEMYETGHLVERDTRKARLYYDLAYEFAEQENMPYIVMTAKHKLTTLPDDSILPQVIDIISYDGEEYE